MKKIFLLIILFQNLIFSQNSEGTISEKTLNHCFENLNPIKELDTYPHWKDYSCSIFDHLILLQLETKDSSLDVKIHKSVLDGLCEVAKRFYLNKTPVILTSGLDSSFYANEKNKNIEDDDTIIYVSIGECILPTNWYQGKEAFNAVTRKLLENK